MRAKTESPYLTCLSQGNVRALIAVLVCSHLGWATQKAFGFWFRFPKSRNEKKKTWKHKYHGKKKNNTEIKKWMNDVPQNTLNYQRFQRFTIVSTSQKQLQSIRKCKVVTGKSTKEKFTNLLWGTVSIFLYLQWTVYTFWSSFSY